MDDEICKVCMGQGNLLIKIKTNSSDHDKDELYYHICPNCDGSGKVMWLNEMLGIENRVFTKKGYKMVRHAPRSQFSKTRIPLVKLTDEAKKLLFL